MKIDPSKITPAQLADAEPGRQDQPTIDIDALNDDETIKAIQAQQNAQIDKEAKHNAAEYSTATGETLKAVEAATAQAVQLCLPQTCIDAADWLKEPDEPENPLVRGLIECGETVAIVGQSKAGKSFITLQLAVCIALGIPYLGRETKRAPVYIANLEVSRRQYKKRLRKLLARMGKSPDELRGWLFVDNMKGENATWGTCRMKAHANNCTVVVIDPFYQIFKGDESDVVACADAIDEMKQYQKDGLTLIVVYHSPKGFSGDRQLIDMISGSSILARFPESIIGLLNHAMQKQSRVVRCVLRNYAPPEDQTITFDEGMFVPDDEMSPTVETSASRWNAKQQQQAATDIEPLVISVLEDNGPQKRKGTLVDMVRNTCKNRKGFMPGEKRVRQTIDAMVDHGQLVEADRQSEQGGAKPIGLPGQMEWYTNPQLKLDGKDGTR